MKKDRNSFFESSSYNMNAMGANFNNMMPPNMSNMNMGSNFYASQNMPMPLPIYPNINNGGMQNETTFTELESRIARLERNINRLDARVSKLEGNNFYSNTTYDNDGSMYMV